MLRSTVAICSARKGSDGDGPLAKTKGPNEVVIRATNKEIEIFMREFQRKEESLFLQESVAHRNFATAALQDGWFDNGAGRCLWQRFVRMRRQNSSL
jgi:hypothetical protein